MTFSFLVALNCLSSPGPGGTPSPLIAGCLLPSLVQALCGQLQLLWVLESSGHICLLRQFFMTFLQSHSALQFFPPLLGGSQTLRGSDVVGICHVRLNIYLFWAPWSAMILRISCPSLYRDVAKFEDMSCPFNKSSGSIPRTFYLPGHGPLSKFIVIDRTSSCKWTSEQIWWFS